ncbi:uncharacterized protein IWZ02DRAFT_502522 [Phyllosticta citriasiana]|uniref:uncharacterized protein n=1 Tax=Phyllosticta citriasiana TaxID=595635 RepID=UPI0030FD9A0F
MSNSPNPRSTNGHKIIQRGIFLSSSGPHTPQQQWKQQPQQIMPRAGSSRFPDVMTATMSDVTQHMERLRWNLPPAKGNLEVEFAACVERFCDDVGETMGMSMRRLKSLPGADGCEVKVEERTGGMVMAKELDGVKAEHAKEIDGLNKKIERHEDMMKEIDNTKTEHDKKIESLNREIERHESRGSGLENGTGRRHAAESPPKCFAGSAHTWYTSILSETQRDEVMNDDDGLENWFALLRKRWGMSVNEAHRQLSVLTLTPDDMKRRGDASSRFVTRAIHIGRCIGVEDTYAVLCLADSRLGQELQACVEPPKRGESVDDFVKRIDALRLN